MSEWKDTTSYSRDKERIPTTWSFDLGEGMRITVTSGHIHYKGEWIARCEPFFDIRQLDVKNKEEAQSKAMGLVREKLGRISAAISSGVRALEGK